MLKSMKQKFWFRSVALFAVCGLVCSSSLLGQESGQWRAASNTAKGVTGDIAFAGQKIVINFSGFTVAQIRELSPAESAALFPSAGAATPPGNLYRTSIPAEKRFLHKNTLCGSEETQWVATLVSGHSLQLAFFSGPAMPAMTPDALANATDLCGTYAYVR